MSTATTSMSTTSAADNTVNIKPKNQKSRNGCLTCKKKRLKCDETKPGCNNCLKKNIECGGYSTNFRWKTFEETSTSFKVMKNPSKKKSQSKSIDSNSSASSTTATPAGKLVTIIDNDVKKDTPKETTTSPKITTAPTPAATVDKPADPIEQKPMKRSLSLPESDLFQNALQQASLSIVGKTFQELAKQNELMALGKNPNAGSEVSPNVTKKDEKQDEEIASPKSVEQIEVPKSPMDVGVSPSLMDQFQYNLPSPMNNNNFNSNKKRRVSTPQGDSFNNSLLNGLSPPAFLGSPSFSTLVKAFTDFDSMNIPSPSNIELSPAKIEEALEDDDQDDDDDNSQSLEESESQMVHMKRANSVDSIFSNGSLPQYRKELISFSNTFNNKKLYPDHDHFRLPPSFTLSKKNELTTEFDKIANAFNRYTSTIMSIRDGPTENPWRTVIWPMALEHSVLFKSIASMTLLHVARNDEETRRIGMTYMKQAISELAIGLTDDSVPNEVALATCIALTITDTWSTHVTTGIAHLRGAKSIINKVLHSHANSLDEISPAFKVLCNIFIYHDVLARIVSSQLIDSNAYDQSSDMIKYLTKLDDDAKKRAKDDSLYGGVINDPINVNRFLSGFAGLDTVDDIDPLLGCARDLFLIIGRTASLITKTRSVSKISFSIVSSAVRLKAELEEWKPKQIKRQPRFEDPYCDLPSIITTAESYRYATLLYLHQAIPEISSQTSNHLAEKVLMLLASIPTNSKTCLLHTFPLLVASCEMDEKEDREWIINRWELLIKLLGIGNIDRAFEVVKEVWRRKDSLRNEHGGNSGKWDIHDQIDALTADKRDAKKGVNSWTHWSMVMREWGWEILLG